MKKRIPIFSALVFLYGVMVIIQQTSNLLPAALMIALGVLAIMVAEKPELTNIAGIVGLAWAGWSALSLLSGIGTTLRMMAGDSLAIFHLIGRIPNIVVIVIWLIQSLRMVQGKFQPMKVPGFLQILGIAFLFVLCGGIAAIAQTGGQNVAGILINGLIKCIPMVALYFASSLLHVTFHQPQESPALTQQHVKTVITYAVIIALVLAVSFACSSSSGGGGRGDGKNTCRNCGRDVPLVAGFGFCGTCYEGFVDWQETSWKD